MYDEKYKTKERNKNKNKPTNYFYDYINVYYNYHSIDYLIIFFSLLLTYKAYISYLTYVLTATAIWSGNFLVFYNIWGGNWSGIVKRTILFCFVLFWCYSCVYNTNKTTKVLFTDPVSTTAELDLLIRILSPHNKILCVLLVTVTILTTFTLYFTRILGLVTKYNIIQTF